MTKNICIAYNAGSYGTFVDWCINYFSNSNFPQNLPFCHTGSSHKFKGNHFLSFEQLKDFATNNILNFQTFRVHPKNKEQHNLEQNLSEILAYSRKIILLHPTYDSIVWNINNKFEKIGGNYFEKQENNILKNITNWGAQSLKQMLKWELREFLSFYIYQQHLSETELENILNLKEKFPEICFVEIEKLRDNFSNTIKELLAYCELPLINEDKINFVYTNWLDRQFHKNKDLDINTIVFNILQNKDFDWSDKNLTLIDEAMIQMKLQENNLKIKCYNLNNLPTSVAGMRPLIYAA